MFFSMLKIGWLCFSAAAAVMTAAVTVMRMMIMELPESHQEFQRLIA